MRIRRTLAFALAGALALAAPAAAQSRGDWIKLLAVTGNTASAVDTVDLIPPQWARGVLIAIDRTSASTGTVAPQIFVSSPLPTLPVHGFSANPTAVDLATTSAGRWLVYPEDLAASYAATVSVVQEILLPERFLIRVQCGGTISQNFELWIQWLR